MIKYNIDVYYLNGDMCAQHKGVSFGLQGVNNEVLQVLKEAEMTMDHTLVGHQYIDMIWIAEEVNQRMSSGIWQNTFSYNARIHDSNGNVIRKFDKVRLDTGDLNTLSSHLTDTIMCHFKGPVSLVLTEDDVHFTTPLT